MAEIAIKIDNLNKVYKLYDRPIDRMKEALSFSRKKYGKDHYALKDFSFKIYKGKTVGIIGTNGSGKSTLLKIITGVLTQTSGTVTVNGKISALLELGAGFNPEYTGIENIYLNGTMIGYSRDEMEKRVPAIADFADIGEFIYQPVKTYSSGMFARLAFAVAINIDPEILIVDEALSVGDVFFQSKCYKKFEDFKQSGKTILFVSHDMGSILKYCDTAILINKGKMISYGATKDVVDDYKKLLVNQLDKKEMKQSENIDIIEDHIINKIEKSNWNERMVNNPKIIEYGNKMAEILDYCTINNAGDITSTIEKKSKFIVKMKVKFNSQIKNPIFAYTIKDLKGTEITGTNTLFENIDFKKPKIGDIFEVSFSQSMDLQGGQYLLSFGCTSYNDNGELVVYHRLYDACTLMVVSTKNTVGFYDMNALISIKQI